MSHLVMFDIDGTLTQTTRVDGSCYAKAMAEHLRTDIDTDWSTYRHPTDSGIALELFQRAGRPTPTARDLAPVRRRFMTLLATAIAANARACAPVPGAAALLEGLRTKPGVSLSIATGAWEDAARLKLRHAALPVNDLPIASGDDAVSREGIMTISLQRATDLAGVAAFDQVTYVGDQPWDLAASRTLGFRFVGVDVDGDGDRLRTAGAETVVHDFTDADPSIFILGS